MKLLPAALALAFVGVVAGVVFLWPSQRTGPEPINYGRDVCGHCRMHISQPGFAGELRDARGTLTKYDDIGCMLRTMADLRHEAPEAWVEDHGGGGLVPLRSARLVRSERVETPMGYGIVAFKDGSAAETFSRAQGGEVLAVEDVLREPARFAPERTEGATTRRGVDS
jgi:copper chaperone NosL